MLKICTREVASNIFSNGLMRAPIFMKGIYDKKGRLKGEKN
jgi:hypothetical protein